jgi:hypothetical protein
VRPGDGWSRFACSWLSSSTLWEGAACRDVLGALAQLVGRLLVRTANENTEWLRLL